MRLIVVSNREPYRLEPSRGKAKFERTVGGLVSALEPVLREYGGTWVCWGRKGKSPGEIKVSDSFKVKFVPLTSGDISGYYYGYSNETLWPLCHMFLTRTRFDSSFWTAYRI